MVKKLLLISLALIGAVVVIASAYGALVYYGGFVDISADTPHEAIVFDIIVGAGERAIERRVREITPPADPSDPERVERGAGNYQAMGASCLCLRPRPTLSFDRASIQYRPI